MKPTTRKIAIIIGVLLIIGVALAIIRGNEDTWIKDKDGNWVKHGNPAIYPVK